VGIGDAVQRVLKRLGLNTVAKLAHSVGRPGEPLPEATMSAWLAAQLPASSLGDQAGVKQMLFEAQTLVVAELREQVTHPEKIHSRPMPAAEREQRLSVVRTKLVGIEIKGPNEPSHALLDRLVTQFREDVLRYVPPELCTSRTHEILNVSTKPQKVLDIQASTLVVTERLESPEVPATSALQVQEALVRRGIGMEYAGMISYEVYSRYVTKLFAHLHRDPPQGMSRVTVTQLVEADKQVFHRLIEADIKLRPTALGLLPLDSALLPAFESYEVSFALMPLPLGKGGKGGGRPNPKKRPFSYNQDNQNKKGRGKGKGKEKQEQFERVPRELLDQGGVSKNPAGQNICFDYNLKGCSNKSCKKGQHVCARCFGQHPIGQCNKSA
jgi:hypothetical protein